MIDTIATTDTTGKRVHVDDNLQRLISTGLAVVGQLQAAGQAEDVRRLRLMASRLDARLQHLVQRTDSRDLGQLFSRLTWKAAQDTRDTKLRILSAIYCGRYENNIDDDYVDAFMLFAERLDPIHIEILKAVELTPADDTPRNGEPDMLSYPKLTSSLLITSDSAADRRPDLMHMWLHTLVDNGLLRTRMMSRHHGSVVIGINLVGLMKMQAFSLSPLAQDFLAILSKYTDPE